MVLPYPAGTTEWFVTALESASSSEPVSSIQNLLTWKREQLRRHSSTHGTGWRRVSCRRRCDPVGIAILWIRRRSIARRRLQHRRLLLVGVMRHGASSSALRSVWLGRRQMGMDVHVWLGLTHAAEGSRAGIVALLGKIIFRIQALVSQIRLWRGAPRFLSSRSTGQTRASAGTARARLLLCVL